MNRYYLHLTIFNKSAIINSLQQDVNKNIICFYADFNVINLFYKKNIFLHENIILYPDSTAVSAALFILFRTTIKTFVSTDLQLEILSYANKLKKKIFFFGDKEDVLIDLKKNVIENYPNLRVVGLQSGYDYSTENLLEIINKTKPDILFVGLGVGRQETWIIKNLTKLNVPLILSVGGWFRYLAGIKKRAPKIISNNLSFL